jgi:hypothetical protein
MQTELVTAPDGVLEDKPRGTLVRHLLPDIADRLQFDYRDVAAHWGKPEFWRISPDQK